MKNILWVLFVFLAVVAIAIGQDTMSAKPKSEMKAASSMGVEDQIKNMELNWGHAVVKDRAASVDKYEADDCVSTDPSGRVTDKDQDRKDLSSDDLKFESIEPSDMKVHSFGNAAVVNGTTTVKGTFKGQDISGVYRFTDTWVKRNGKWQVVAATAVKVQQQ